MLRKVFFTKNPKPKVAKKDIVCYKVVLFKDDYYTPYRHIKVKIPSKIYTAQLGEPIFNNKKYFGFRKITINEGLHSCKSYKDALELKKSIYTYYHSAIVECVIPKSSLYYKNNSFYVSNQLKYNRIINIY